MLIGLIVVVVLLIVGSLLFLFSDRIRQISEKKNFSKKAGKKIYALARDNDFYLINQVALSIDTKVIHFDHILFTDKFIYCIGKSIFQDRFPENTTIRNGFSTMKRITWSISRIR